MAKAATKPRLRTMAPVDVARDVLEDFRAFYKRVHQNAAPNPPGYGADPVVPPVFKLADKTITYAIHGRGGSFADARALAAVLYSSPAEPMTEVDPEQVIEGRAPDRPIDVALLAAEARHRIEHNERVTIRGLAALASVHPNEVRRTSRLSKRDGRAGPPIAATAAARWLAERGLEITPGGAL